MKAIGLLGEKIGMTQIFNSKGDAIPVTILQLGPCLITQVKTEAKEGYSAIQIGYKNTKKKRINKCELGHLRKSELPMLKYLKEFRLNSHEEFKVGQKLTLSKFKAGSYIDVTAKSIGKGFTGYQKRHGFTRGPMSHGSKNHRLPGSIGAGTTPGRVFPGKRMAGRKRSNQVTIKNLKIIGVNTEDNLLLVKGSVPGKAGNFIKVTSRQDHGK